jgi:hypothetical protein
MRANLRLDASADFQTVVVGGIFHLGILQSCILGMSSPGGALAALRPGAGSQSPYSMS